MTQTVFQDRAIHDDWAIKYTSPERDEFLNMTINHVIKFLRKDALILDTGCGFGRRAIRLARKGFRVEAIDISDYALQVCRESVKAEHLDNLITVRKENLLSLSFSRASFDVVHCWGVLTHIDNLEKAIAELSRVVKYGGYIIVEENNMGSIEQQIYRFVRMILGNANYRRVNAGYERIDKTPSGDDLLTRETDIAYLVNSFRKLGVVLLERRPAEFTESYIFSKSKIVRKMIHWLNRLLFRHPIVSRFATCNLLIFQNKPDSERLNLRPVGPPA